ncbi:MAG: HEAT repeat domain-containing protein, partial [Planctomycetota bacterium]
HIRPLLNILDDEDWVVRQAAWAALNNLTGMEFPYDALAAPDERAEQIARWRRWWSSAPEGRAPLDVFRLAANNDPEARLRAVRALGAFGGQDATATLLKLIEPYRGTVYESIQPTERTMVQAAMRSLGRLCEPQALPILIEFMDGAGWASRYAADALGLYGDPAAIQPLVNAYPRFAKNLFRELAQEFPADDRARLGWDPQDRMYETPYAIMVAISRLPLDDPNDLRAVSTIVPLIVANIPSDWDGGLLYEREAHQLVTAYLLERTGFRRAAIEAAFDAAANLDGIETYYADRQSASRTLSKQSVKQMDSLSDSKSVIEDNLRLIAQARHGDVPYLAQWLPALCRDEQDIPRLVGLLDHSNHWIRINATKALMFMDARSAIAPLGERLAASHPEGAYRFSGVLEHAEYNDPTPRWREAFVRALGRLGATQYAPLIVSILEDERNVVDVRYAAALALDELGTPGAIAALKRADSQHEFHTVRLVAREALWKRGLLESIQRTPISVKPKSIGKTTQLSKQPRAVIFIKGRNRLRTDFNDQSGVDPWRETYSVTNSGPTMRVGKNIFALRPATRDGNVTPLTNFDGDFVADCELSWDARKVIFARRINNEDRHWTEVPHEKPVLREPGERVLGGKDDPWWHLWEMNIDGTGLKQLTFGPYHDVNPILPDGRIMFSSTRIGMRDEYHGFPCTGLTVCNADGSDIHCIGFNLGGDREPATLDDGRIVFSRLDLFYSRLKTEFTVQAVFPD